MPLLSRGGGLAIRIHRSLLSSIRVGIVLCAVIIKAVIVWGRTMGGLNINPILANMALHRGIPAILRHNRQGP